MSCLPAVLFLLLAPTGGRALDLYLVRHAETMGNMTGDYGGENQRTFSPRGLEQIKALPRRLEELRFDFILVSPAWRTQQTILPYLKATGQKAEICPEIEETDCGIEGAEAPAAEPPRGEPVEIIPEGTNCFTLPDGPSSRHYAPRDRSDGLAILQRAVQLIRSRFGGTTQSVLLVTHSCTGGRLMELLLGLPARGAISPGNAALCRLSEKPDGTFDLVLYNNEPMTALRRVVFYGFDPKRLPGFLNLAGEWRIAKGDDAAWAKPAADESAFQAVTVPGGWEKSALPEYDGIAWYRHHFAVTAGQAALWRNEALALILGAVDDADETYLNGRLVGSSGRFSPERITAWDQPRIYPIDSALLSTDNVIAVRVDDWGGGGGIWRDPVAIGPVRVLTTPAP